MTAPADILDLQSVALRGAFDIARQVLLDGDAQGGYLAASSQMCANAPQVMLFLATIYADCARDLSEKSGETVEAILEESRQRFVEAERQLAEEGW